MKFDNLLEQMRNRMPLKRWEHTKGVAMTAVHLAKKYGEDVDKAEIAGILHDVAKFSDRKWLKQIIISENLDPQLLTFHHELWHGPVGSVIAKKEFHIDDIDILHAIRFHTTGRAGMSNLEKIIYVSDMIEPSRNFSGIDILRDKAESDLNDAMISCVTHSIQFLMKKNQPVYPDSFHCYNDLIHRKEK